jgi:hypothetical protein
MQGAHLGSWWAKPEDGRGHGGGGGVVVTRKGKTERGKAVKGARKLACTIISSDIWKFLFWTKLVEKSPDRRTQVCKLITCWSNDKLSYIFICTYSRLLCYVCFFFRYKLLAGVLISGQFLCIWCSRWCCMRCPYLLNFIVLKSCNIYSRLNILWKCTVSDMCISRINII